MNASTPEPGPARATDRASRVPVDAAEPMAPHQAGMLADHLHELRRARAGLAWLFEPDTPILHELLAQSRLTRVFRRLAERAAIAPDDLRREIRHLPTRDAWTAADATVAAAAGRFGARVVIPEDDDWPTGVADLARADRDPHAPAALCLWVRGDHPVAAALARSVAVLGARAATEYGTHVATNLGVALAYRGWAIVASGGHGIDSAALRGALTTDTPAVAVLPGGLDQPQSTDRQHLFDQLAQRGLVVSQWPPGATPNRSRMATTQRLIAGLADGTVVVEATTRSGSLTSLYQAITLGRPAMAVPGPVTSVTSAGCHQILRDCPQARLVTNVDDILDALATDETAATT